VQSQYINTFTHGFLLLQLLELRNYLLRQLTFFWNTFSGFLWNTNKRTVNSNETLLGFLIQYCPPLLTQIREVFRVHSFLKADLKRNSPEVR
jgi:hypothetical protein